MTWNAVCTVCCMCKITSLPFKTEVDSVCMIDWMLDSHNLSIVRFDGKTIKGSNLEQLTKIHCFYIQLPIHQLCVCTSEKKLKIKNLQSIEKMAWKWLYNSVKHSGKINSLFYLYLRIRCTNGYNPRQEECRQHSKWLKSCYVFGYD